MKHQSAIYRFMAVKLSFKSNQAILIDLKNSITLIHSDLLHERMRVFRVVPLQLRVPTQIRTKCIFYCSVNILHSILNSFEWI